MVLTTSRTTDTLPTLEAIGTVPDRRHRSYGGIAVGLGVLATAVLLVALLVPSDRSSTAVPHTGIVERGSITAVDRAPTVAGRRVSRPDARIVDRNLEDPGSLDRSIVAIDHAAALERSAHVRTVLDRGLLDPGSTERTAG